MSDAMIMRRGGGVKLNFRINQYAPGTDLSNFIGKTNEIAVLTNTPLADWSISMTEPPLPTVGSVWVRTGVNSLNSLNALKKNTIKLDLQGVYQYVTGNWERKKSYLWQKGKWNDLDIFVYNRGDQCTDKTGGWSKSEYNGTVTFYDDHIGLVLSAGGIVNVFTVEKVDFSGYTTLKIKYGNINTNNAYLWVGSSTSSPYSTTVYISKDESEATLDVSAYKNSELYIGVYLPNNGQLDVFEIWFE